MVRRIPLDETRPDEAWRSPWRCSAPRTRLLAISHVTTDWGVRLPAARSARLARRAVCRRRGSRPFGGRLARGPATRSAVPTPAPCPTNGCSRRTRRVRSTSAPTGWRRCRGVRRRSGRGEPRLRRAGRWRCSRGCAPVRVRALVVAAGPRLGGGARLCRGLGLDAIERRTAALTNRMKAGLAAIPGVTLHTPRSGRESAAAGRLRRRCLVGPALESGTAGSVRHPRACAGERHADGVRASVRVLHAANRRWTVSIDAVGRARRRPAGERLMPAIDGAACALLPALPAAPTASAVRTTRSNCRSTRRCSCWSTSTAPEGRAGGRGHHEPPGNTWPDRSSRTDRAGEGGRSSGRAPDRVRHQPAARRAVRRQRVADDVAADPSASTCSIPGGPRSTATSVSPRSSKSAALVCGAPRPTARVPWWTCRLAAGVALSSHHWVPLSPWCLRIWGQARYIS